MKKLIITIFSLTIFLLLPKIAAAGIILRPVINTGLVGYWSFNEGTGTKVGDMSGMGNNGTWYGSGSHWTDGKFGKGGDFVDTSSDYLNCGTNDIYSFSDNFTISAWVKSALPSDNFTYIIAVRADHNYFLDPGEKGYNLILRRSGGAPWASLNVGGALDAKGADFSNFPNDGQWHHIVGMKKGNTIEIYVDNVSGTPNTATFGDITASGETFYIGKDRGAQYYFNGQIDEVRIYNRDLDASEITKLYNSGLSRIGINQLGLVDPQLPANATVSYVRENCDGYSPCYNTLSAWEAAFGGFGWDGCTPGDLTCLGRVAVARIDGTWNSPDGDLDIDGWTTNAANYIYVYTTESARHPGKWDETKYRLEGSSSYVIGVIEEYTRISGLQIKINATSGYMRGIIGYIDNVNSDIRISDSIFRGNCSGTDACEGIITIWNYSGNYKIWNNIFYDFLDAGVQISQNAVAQVYNNTSVHNGMGYVVGGASVFIAKNNIAYGNTDNYYADSVFDDYSSNNLSGPSSDAQCPSTNSRNGVQVHFVDVANDDFHLSPADMGARNYGANLSNDASISFQFDIDRQERKGTWDIGADEARGTIANAPQVNQLTNGLVGYWTFDGTKIDGTEAYDSSVNNYTGTLTSGPTVIDGKVGQALNFDGVDDTVALGAILDGMDATGMSISAWIRPITAGESSIGRMVDKNTGLTGGWYFSLFGNALRFWKDGATDLNVQSNNGTISLNRWSHVSMTWDGSTTATNVHFYIDGVETTYSVQTSGDSFVSDATRVLNIGARPGGAFTFDGILDEVRLYNRALEAEEVKRLYNLGR